MTARHHVATMYSFWCTSCAAASASARISSRMDTALLAVSIFASIILRLRM